SKAVDAIATSDFLRVNSARGDERDMDPDQRSAGQGSDSNRGRVGDPSHPHRSPTYSGGGDLREAAVHLPHRRADARSRPHPGEVERDGADAPGRPSVAAPGPSLAHSRSRGVRAGFESYGWYRPGCGDDTAWDQARLRRL